MYFEAVLKSYRSIIGASVKHFEDGTGLGVVKDVIIHPDTGRLEGLWVKPADGAFAYGVVQSADIVEWKKAVYLKSADAIADPADIIKIADILADGRQIVGNRVFTEAGAYLGRVSDVDFDTEQHYLKHLVTEKVFLFFSWDRRVLAYDLILEVRADRIVIKEDKSAQKESVAPVINERNIALDT